MTTAICHPFADYLKTQLELGDHELPEPGEWGNVGNTTGALSLRLDLLTVDQIDHILELQENESQRKLFGELAVELGYLTQEQVERLLEVQQLNRQLEAGEQLVLAGKMSVTELVELMLGFLRQA